MTQLARLRFSLIACALASFFAGCSGDEPGEGEGGAPLTPSDAPATLDLTITKVTLNQGAQVVLFDAAAEVPAEPEPEPETPPGKAFGEACGTDDECSTGVCTPLVGTCGERCESAQCDAQSPDCCPISGAPQCLFGYCVAQGGGGGAGSGEPVDLAPIASRSGMLKVEITPDTGAQDRPVVVQLAFGDGFSDQQTVSVSGEAPLVVDFAFTGEDFPLNAPIRVDVLEVSRGLIAQWEAGEEENAMQTGTLSVVLVPVRFNGDGSGRLPDTSAAQLALYKDWMTRLYPLADIDLTVREPWDYDGSLGTQGWTSFLQAVQTLRSQDQPADNVYYHAIVAPADSFAAYCQGGCVAGLAPVPGPGQPDAQVSTGLGFTGQEAAETMAHEVGHAHGREHAPCGLFGQPSDPGYPYDNAQIGGPGYDVVEQKAVDTAGKSDIMSYCAPYWVSDYTFAGLAERMAVTNGVQARFVGEPRAVQTLIVNELGELSQGGTLKVRQLPGGVPVEVLLLDARGRVHQTQTVPMQLLDHASGGFIYLDGLPPWVHAVAYGGQTVVLK